MIDEILQNKSNSVTEARTDLLPAFNANSAIPKESFRDLMNSIRANSYGINKKTYNDKQSYSNNYNQNKYNNSYDKSYNDSNDNNRSVSYREKFSSNDKSKYSYNDDNNYSKYDKQYDYTEFDRDLGVKEIESEDAYNQELKNKIENLAQNDGTVSLNDLIDLLQTLQSGEQISDESEINNQLTEIKNILSSLNISSEQKDKLDQILSKLQMMSSDDLQAMSKIISLIHENILEEKVGVQVDPENMSEDSVSNKLAGDSENIKAFNKLLAQIKEVEKSLNAVEGLDSDQITSKLENLIGKENLTKLENLLNDENVNGLEELVADGDLSELKDLINKKIAELSSNAKTSNTNTKDIVDTELSGDQDFLSLVTKNELSDLNEIISSINNSDVNKNVKETINDIVSLLENVASNELSTENMNSDDMENMANLGVKDTSLKDVVATLKAMAEKILNSQDSSKQIAQGNSDQVAKSDSNIPTGNNTDAEQNVLENELSLRQEAEKNTKDSSTSNVEKIVKESVKHSDAMTTKDLNKEFKGVHIEATETLRGEAKAKHEAQVNENMKTVNFNDSSKVSFAQTLKKQDVSINQIKFGDSTMVEKGNNFNYFLKSSGEAQAKIDQQFTMKEAPQAYNLREPRDIEKLMRNIQSSVNKGESKLSVVLTPENLGKLHIQLTETGGKVTAKFIAENETSHKLIMSQGDLLKNQLSEKGIVIDNMEFAFNDAMSNKGEQHSENSKRSGRNGNRNKNDKDMDIEVTAEKTKKHDSGVYA